MSESADRRYSNGMTRYQIFLGLLVGLCTLPVAATAQSELGVVCIKGNNIAVRGKCLAGETRATVGLLTKKGFIGDTGATGGGGVSGRQAVFTTYSNQTIPFIGQGLVRTETCPAGKIIVGGGCRAADTGAAIVQSYPTESLTNQWTCVFKSRTDGTGVVSSVTTLAICIDG